MSEPSAEVPSGSSAPALELKEVSRRYGAVLANDGVSITANKGSIHAIVGENGAGKTTAMKMAYGMVSPDAGEILVHGRKARFRGPADAINLGVGMVHQHFMLAGPHTALDNIILGNEPSVVGFISRRKARDEISKIAAEYNVKSFLDRPVREMPVGVQQRLEILKLLYRRADILILDEPTAVLTPLEADALFSALRQLAGVGKAILLITHKLKEVMAVSDRVSVFRQGKVVAERRTAETSVDELAELMIGRRLMPQVFERSTGVVGGRGVTALPVVLDVLDLSVENQGRGGCALQNISFSIRSGEIVGVAGVEGNGQSELIEVLSQATDDPSFSGTIRIAGVDIGDAKSRSASDSRVAIIPEDRHRQGLMLERPVSENFLLGHQKCRDFARAGFILFGRLREAVATEMERHDVRPRNPNLRAGSLSGGNQQKLIVAREMHKTPRLLIAAQPTRGVDIGAIESIHAEIISARERGAGVLLISSELDEILKLSDRIFVMSGGRLAAEFQRGAVTEREIGLKMGGS
jgi:simple sugar transport system ATP-binding protein